MLVRGLAHEIKNPRRHPWRRAPLARRTARRKPARLHQRVIIEEADRLNLVDRMLGSNKLPSLAMHIHEVLNASAIWSKRSQLHHLVRDYDPKHS